MAASSFRLDYTIFIYQQSYCCSI